MRKLAVLLLIGCLLAFSACRAPSAISGPSSPPGQTTLTWQQHTDPVTLTMISQITADPATSSDAPLWGEDAISRMIKNLTGITLDIRYQSVYGLDLEVLLASGETADLICTTSSAVCRLLENGSMASALDILSEKYCPDFWNDIDVLEQLNNQASDGHIYTLRNNYYSSDVYNDERIPIYPPWTLQFNNQLLGSHSLPASIEELDILLQQASKENILYPLVMIDAVSSPIPGWMGIRRDLYWDQETRSVHTPLRDDGWLDYLILANRWYRSGYLHLLSDEYDVVNSLNDAYGWLEENLPHTLVFASSQRYALEGTFYTAMSTAEDPWPWTVAGEPLTYEGEVQLIAADNRAGWGYDPLKYTAGARGMADTSCALYISSTCSQPDRALYFYQFLRSDDGSRLTHWGLEGVHYTQDSNGFITYTDGYRTDAQHTYDSGRVYNTISNKDGLQYWTFVGNDAVRGILNGSPEAYLTNPTVLEMRRQNIEAGLVYKDYLYENKCPVLHFAQPTYGTADYDTYAQIVNLWQGSVNAIVTESQSATDVEQAWQSLMNQLANQGLDAIEFRMTDRFTQALERYHAAGYYTEIKP